MAGLFDRPGTWILILVVILLFGAKRLPDLARGVGRSMRIFKAETEGLRGDTTSADGAPVASPSSQAQAVVAPAPAIPAAVQPAAPAPRYLVDPVTGETVLAQPVTPPADGATRV
jgi:sec-independent protein translocase protein TatA